LIYYNFDTYHEIIFRLHKMRSRKTKTMYTKYCVNRRMHVLKKTFAFGNAKNFILTYFLIYDIYDIKLKLLIDFFVFIPLFNIFLKYHIRQKQFSFFNNVETRTKTLFFFDNYKRQEDVPISVKIGVLIIFLYHLLYIFSVLYTADMIIELKSQTEPINNISNLLTVNFTYTTTKI